MADHVELTIDGKRVLAERGTTILNAALDNGIYIPHICYDRRLTPFGGCRLCVVEVEGQRKLRAACSSPVEPGLVITTDTEKLRRARKTVLELLLIHHPLDCPICDKAGECTLQEMAFKYGPTASRFKAEKRHEPEITEAPLVERNPNRCILCGKCVKICQEHQGVGAINFIGRGFDVKISPAFEETLDCEFCGQCIDICPVGALGSKPYRYRSRVWFMEDHHTTCPYCGVGCTVTLGVREGKIVRSVGRDGVGINKGDLCGRGRFGFDYVGSEKRLKTPLIKKDGRLVEATWEEALDTVAGRLSAISSAHGPAAIGAIGSPRCTLEDNYMMQKFMRGALGTNNIDSLARFGYAKAQRAIKKAFGIDALPTNFDAPLKADTILVIESDLTSTHPVFGLRLLKGQRDNKARLIVADAKMTKLSRHATDWLRLRPGTSVALLNSMMKVVIDEGLYSQAGDVDEGIYADDRAAIEGFEALRDSLRNYTPEEVETITGLPSERIREAARAMAGSKNRLLCMTLGAAEISKGEDTVLAACNLLMLLGSGPEALQLPADYANTLGSLEAGIRPDAGPSHAPLAAPGLDIHQMLYEDELPIKALYIMGENPLISFPRVGSLQRALGQLEFLVVQDIMLTDTAKLADVVLPASGWSEKEGSFVSAMGHKQRAVKCLPSTGDSIPDWQIFRNLARLMGHDLGAKDLDELREEVETHVPLDFESRQPTFRFHPVEFKDAEPTDVEYPYAMLTGVLMQHSGSLTSLSKSLGSVASDAYLQIHPRDAKRQGIEDENYVKLSTRRGEVYVKARITDEVREGMLFIPSHFAHTKINTLTYATHNGTPSMAAARVEKTR